jgi:hypothetical protein
MGSPFLCHVTIGLDMGGGVKKEAVKVNVGDVLSIQE